MCDVKLWDGTAYAIHGACRISFFLQDTETIRYQSGNSLLVGTIVTQADHHFGWQSNIDFSAMPKPLPRPAAFMSRRTDRVLRTPKPSSSASCGRTCNGCRLLMSKHRLLQLRQERQWLSQPALNSRETNDSLWTSRTSACRPILMITNNNSRGKTGPSTRSPLPLPPLTTSCSSTSIPTTEYFILK